VAKRNQRGKSAGLIPATPKKTKRKFPNNEGKGRSLGSRARPAKGGVGLSPSSIFNAGVEPGWSAVGKWSQRGQQKKGRGLSKVRVTGDREQKKMEAEFSQMPGGGRIGSKGVNMVGINGQPTLRRGGSLFEGGKKKRAKENTLWERKTSARSYPNARVVMIRKGEGGKTTKEGEVEPTSKRVSKCHPQREGDDRNRREKAGKEQGKGCDQTARQTTRAWSRKGKEEEQTRSAGGEAFFGDARRETDGRLVSTNTGRKRGGEKEEKGESHGGDKKKKLAPREK